MKTLNARNVAVDAVEIDPQVVAAAKAFFGIAEGPLCHIIEQDGRPVAVAATGSMTRWS